MSRPWVWLMVVCLACASAPVLGQTVPSSAASTTAQGKQLHEVRTQLQNQKQTTQKLHQRVDTLTRQQQADQEKLQQRERTIAHLRKQLEALSAKSPPSDQHDH